MFRRRRRQSNSAADVPLAIATPIENTTASTPTRAIAEQHICYTCRRTITSGSKHILISHIAGRERRYHTDCFKCYGCKTPIEPKTQQLCFSCDKKQDGGNSNQREKHPFHKQCYNTFFGWLCVVCGETLPTASANDSNDGGRTKIEYLKHPFFDNEVR